MEQTKSIPWRQLREIIFNVLLCIFVAFLAYRFLLDYQKTGRLSSLLFVIFEIIVAVISISRRTPKAVSWKPLDWTYALLATLLPLCFWPAPTKPDPVWFAVQCIGQSISMIGILSINRSLGVVPANRGVKTNGLYRVVRHPIYCGYLITDMAMVMQNFIYGNMIIAAAHFVVQSLRIMSEERFLLQDPAYAEYAARVRWRLVPWIW